jgi:hypothetical protein
MPRHPPFALRNLKSHEFDRIRATPESAAKLTSEYAKQHTRRHALGDSPFVIQDKVLNLRCSRPLCSSQQTARTPTPTSKADLGEGLKKPSPPNTPKERQGSSGPSGPNSVHAPIRPAPDHSNPTKARRTRSETIRTSTYVNVPPMSNQQATLDLIWSALRKPEDFRVAP